MPLHPREEVCYRISQSISNVFLIAEIVSILALEVEAAPNTLLYRIVSNSGCADILSVVFGWREEIEVASKNRATTLAQQPLDDHRRLQTGSTGIKRCPRSGSAPTNDQDICLQTNCLTHLVPLFKGDFVGWKNLICTGK